MAIAFAGGLFHPDIYPIVLENSTGLVHNAADTLQKSFVDGLAQYDSVEVFSVPFIGEYPIRYKRPYSPATKICEYATSYGKRISFHNLSFFNLFGLISSSRSRVLSKALLSWCEAHAGEPRCIVAYGMFADLLSACNKAKKRFPDVKVVLIVPDLPQFMSVAERGLVRQIYHSTIVRADRKRTYALSNCVDAFVFLSKHMAQYISVGRRPWTVVEGIYRPSDGEPDKEMGKPDAPFTILYTGTLAKKYGVMDLMEAFARIPDDDMRLIICGAGDAEPDIRAMQAADSRIDFRGQVSRSQAVGLQREAHLLVNPRKGEGEFTKVSFPSKTIEYLSSGTPALICRLEGIPDEYYEYCYTFDGSDPEDLSRQIRRIKALAASERAALAAKARKFIVEEKNPLAQASKLRQLISDLI